MTFHFSSEKAILQGAWVCCLMMVHPPSLSFRTRVSTEQGLPWWLSGKESACQCGRRGFDPWVRKIPWRRAWLPAPVFLPGESPWTEEPGRLQSMGLQRVGHGWATNHTHTQHKIKYGLIGQIFILRHSECSRIPSHAVHVWCPSVHASVFGSTICKKWKEWLHSLELWSLCCRKDQIKANVLMCEGFLLQKNQSCVD